jgi:hypothetical protein
MKFGLKCPKRNYLFHGHYFENQKYAETKRKLIPKGEVWKLSFRFEPLLPASDEYENIFRTGDINEMVCFYKVNDGEV